MAPSTEPDHVGDILHNSGWGKPSDGKSDPTFPAFSYQIFNPFNWIDAAGISPTLNEVYMPCMSNAECALTFGNTITDGNICTDTTGGHSSCNVRSTFSNF